MPNPHKQNHTRISATENVRSKELPESRRVCLIEYVFQDDDDSLNHQSSDPFSYSAARRKELVWRESESIR
jgi:hypothetical protein